MKLPADRKERMQILALLGIAAAGALFALARFVAAPLARAHREIPARLEELESRIEDADRALAVFPDQIERFNAVVNGINSDVERHLLQPVLGSYILEAERLIERQAAALGVKIDAYREIGIRDLPRPPRRRQGHRLRSYTVNVTLKTDFDTLTRLIDAIEKSYPFVSVLSLHIVEQPRSLPAHEVRFDIQWPIWGGAEDPPRPRTE